MDICIPALNNKLALTSVLVWILALGFLPSAKAVSAKTNKYKALTLVETKKAGLEDLVMAINKKSLNLDLARTNNIRIKIDQPIELYRSIDRLASFEVRVFEINNDTGEEKYLTSQVVTSKKGINRSRAVSLSAGYFNEPSKHLIFKLYDSNGDLVKVYEAEINAFNLDTQIQTSAGSKLSTTPWDSEITEEEFFNWLFGKMQIEARPQKQASTRITKLDNRYLVTVPFPRRKFQFLGKKVRRKAKDSIGTGSGGGSTGDFGDTINTTTINLGDNNEEFQFISYEDGDLNFNDSFFLDLDGKVGINQPDPQGWLHISSKSGSSEDVPILVLDPKDLTTTTPPNGSIEFDGDDLYITKNGTRTKLGAKGDSGPQGPTGPQGPPGASNGSTITNTYIYNGDYINGDIFNSFIYNGTFINGSIFNSYIDNGRFTNGNVYNTNIDNGNYTNGYLASPYLQDPTINGLAFFTNNSTAQFNGQIHIPAGASNGYILTADANGFATWSSPTILNQGSVAEWFDTGSILHPDDGAGDESVVIGGSNMSNSDITFDNGGAAVFNEQSSAIADFRIESDSFTHAVFIDASTDRVGLNDPTPSALLDVGNGVANFIDGTNDLLVADDAEIDDTLYANTVNANTAYFNQVFANQFNGGNFYGNFFGNGSGLKNVTINGGTITNVTLNNISIDNGTYTNGTTYNSNFYNGSIFNTYIENGNFTNGTIYNTFIYNGDFINGNIFNSYFDNGTITNGSIFNTNIDNGNYTNGYLASPYLQDPTINGLAFFTNNSTAQFNGQIRIPAGATNGYILSSDANGYATWVNPSVISGGGGNGSSEWTDTGTLLHPSDSSGAEDVAIGGTSTGAADILLQADGSAVFNEQSNSVDFRIESNNFSHAVFVDASTDRVGLNDPTPSALLDVGNGVANFIDGTNDLLVADDAEIDDTLYANTVNANTAYFNQVFANQFNGGNFYGNFFGNGSGLKNVTINGGTITNVTLNNISIDNGTYTNGTTYNSNFYNGSIFNTYIENGNFTNGTIYNTFIYNGDFINGDIFNSYFDNGTITNGSIFNTNIDNGNYTNGYLASPYLQDPTINGLAFFTNNSTAQFNGQIRIPAGASNGYILTTDANGFATWSPPSIFSNGGSSEWFDTGSILHPGDNTGDESVVIGGSNMSNSDITFDNGGAAVFNEQSSAIADFRIESDSFTHAVFVDASTDRVGLNDPTPSALLDVGNGVANFIDGTNDLLVADDAEIDDTLYANTVNANTAYFNQVFANQFNGGNFYGNFFGNGSGLKNVTINGGTITNVTLNNISIDNGTYTNGTTYNSNFYNGSIFNGDFINGDIFNSYFDNGTITNGSIFNTNIDNGNYTNGYLASPYLQDPTINGLAFFTNNSIAQFNGQIRIPVGVTNGYVLTTDANGYATWQDPSSLGGGGGSSEWTDAGSLLHPADSSGAEDVGIGGTTVGAADILLQANGSAVFNKQGNQSSFTVEGDDNPNVIKVDGQYNAFGIGEEPILFAYGGMAPTDLKPALTLNGRIAIKEYDDGLGILGYENGHGQIYVKESTSRLYYITPGPSGTEYDLTATGAEWTDTGTLLHPADLSGAEDLAIGGTTVGGADILLQANGNAIFNEQSASVDFRIESNSKTHMFMVDGSTDRIGISTSSPTTDLTINGATAYVPTGSLSIVAGTGITASKTFLRIQGSGGAVDITANPQIAAGVDGQQLILKGLSNTNTVKIDNGTGVSLTDGLSFTMGNKDVLVLIYDANDSEWIEVSRSDKL